jgi:DNA helicase-2/ATP-dependent DNA helicase PcrA
VPPQPPGTVRYSPGHLARLLGLPEPTAEQAAVISAPLEPVAVVAGAGSGKSETMAGRLVWLVANDLVRPEQVLGLTFTRKAAAELGQRVRARLAGLRRAGLVSAAPAAPPAVAAPGAGQPGGGAPARAGAENLGLGDMWEGEDWASEPAAVPPGAGRPGAGPAGSHPAAAGGSGLAEAAGPMDGEPVVSTYHSYAARLVADHALREALEPSLRLITPAVAWQFAARMVAAHAGPMDAVTWSPPEVTAAVVALAGELAEHLRGPADVEGYGDWLRTAAQTMPGSLTAKHRKILECQRAREQLLPIVSAYAEAKAAREVMDYGDQVALAARIATRHPEVGAAERARYRVVLLDEFQDTSHAQLVLLRALFGGGHPVTAVGDPCQSIYGWRGASAGNLRRFAHQFPAARPGEPPRPGRVQLLATSFRNTERVLEVAAEIQRGLADQVIEVPRLVPAPRRSGRGAVVCALLESAAAEARWVAEHVLSLFRLPEPLAPDGEPWPPPGPARGQPRSIAVLCRKRAQFPALRAALEARGIPVEVVGLGGLLTVPEVADIVATLRVLHDPGASGPLARLLTGPRWRIGPRDLVALGRRARDLTGRRPAPGGQSQDEDAGAPGAPGTPDPMVEAVTDLTADPGSLVEALDDLGNSAAYSADGYARFSALASELRGLRAHVGRALPDLVGEVERVLGLDVEVASQPRRDPTIARADLDAFADATASFADDEEEPTLGAFLAYLTAAENEEFGLESGQPSGTAAVTLTTVHAAKGLEWDAVVVPGMSAGAKSRVFPARPRVTTRWTENARLVPFSLRGDADDLPTLPDMRSESLEAFTRACTAREMAEERRLAYVAVTRAAYAVACTGYWWGEGATRLGPSEFLEEARSVCEAGAGTIAHWEPEPDEEAQNPALAEPDTISWPVAQAGAGYEAVEEAAALVERALTAMEPRRGRPPARDHARRQGAPPGAGAPAGAAWPGAPGHAGQPGGPAADRVADEPLTGADRSVARAWTRDTDLLLAELAERRGDAATAVPLPARLSVSSLVTMAANPQQLAQQIRRPMPRPPAPQARRGTAFHRWLEERFGQQRLIDPSDLLGAADDPADDDDAVDLALLREKFEDGDWGDRWPAEVEVPFETRIAGRIIGGRIDAVFGEPGGGFDVVDWKTGEPPGTDEDYRAAAVQLAAYRVAWSRLSGAPLGQVRAAFYYVRHDLTLRPADLLDQAGLAALIEGIPSAV